MTKGLVLAAKEQNTPEKLKSHLIVNSKYWVYILFWREKIPLWILSNLLRYVQPSVKLSKHLKVRIKQDCQYIFLTKKESSKNFNSILQTSKNQARLQLLEKTQSRSRWEFWHQKARTWKRCWCNSAC